jgi:hypothetical protein
MITRATLQFRGQPTTHRKGRRDIRWRQIPAALTLLAAISGTGIATAAEPSPATDFWAHLTALILADRPPTISGLQKLEGTIFESSPAGQGTAYRGNFPLAGRAIQSSYYVYPNLWELKLEWRGAAPGTPSGPLSSCLPRDAFVQELSTHGWRTNPPPFTQEQYNKMTGPTPPAISIHQGLIEAVILLSPDGGRCVSSVAFVQRWPHGRR